MKHQLTLREALQLHYSVSGLPPDGGRLGKTWTIRIGQRDVRVKNFGWRREALPLHDAHHVITGYACNLAGELEMAAWEYAAGRFRHAGATLFCLPLIGIGFVLLPRRAIAAFMRGRRTHSLYGSAEVATLMDTQVAALRAFTPPSSALSAKAADAFIYAGWVAASLAWIALPFAFAALAVHWWIH